MQKKEQKRTKKNKKQKKGKKEETKKEEKKIKKEGKKKKKEKKRKEKNRKGLTKTIVKKTNKRCSVLAMVEKPYLSEIHWLAHKTPTTPISPIVERLHTR